MHIDNFTPIPSLAGGLLIGAAAATLILVNGRIAGISGILGRMLRWPRGDAGWQIAFLAGMIGAPLLVRAVSGAAIPLEIDTGWSTLLAAGFLVGLGTRYAGGCTSGHGVCGMSRGSTRSIVATLTFMAAGVLTVFLQRHVLGG
ncbi:MAG: YeeE/YedE family protein [Burkholderiales bacterium]|nr:YeeE/YedE family protein [Burkholderiales bacterium]MDE2289711.1 YeeE/YedE family protein [Burkholderiales bacterium]